MPADVTEKKRDVLAVRFPGESLHAGTVDVFRSEIEPLFVDHSRLVLDMSGLDFVDSSGLGALITCMNRANAHGGDLKLYGMKDTVYALFEMVRMDRQFDIFKTKEEAIRAFDR